VISDRQASYLSHYLVGGCQRGQ